MNEKRLLGLIACAMIFGWYLQPVIAANGSTPAATSPSELTHAETRDLLFMLEEEKLARDVYNALHELYNQRVFINIPRAEQHHMNAIAGLLNAYGFEEEVQDAGVFANEELQTLYDELVHRGAISRTEAFLVGALIEEVDIQDLEAARNTTDQEDICAVYENLIGGSKRHLNAFVRNYEAVTGQTYKAQRLKQEEVDGILGR